MVVASLCGRGTPPLTPLRLRGEFASSARHGGRRGHPYALSAPKMLHPVCGRAMVAWPIVAAREAGAGRVVAIDSPKQNIVPGLPDKVQIVTQPQPDGTGGAVRAALPLIEEAETVLVLSGDHPLITAENIAGLLEAHAASGAAATMLTIELDDPGSYGRVVRNEAGDVERVVEAKAAGDATPSSWRSARSTPAPMSSRQRSLPRRSPSSPTTTPRASTTCLTSFRPCAWLVTRWRPTYLTTSA